MTFRQVPTERQRTSTDTFQTSFTRVGTPVNPGRSRQSPPLPSVPSGYQRFSDSQGPSRVATRVLGLETLYRKETHETRQTSPLPGEKYSLSYTTNRSIRVSGSRGTIHQGPRGLTQSDVSTYTEGRDLVDSDGRGGRWDMSPSPVDGPGRVQYRTSYSGVDQ